MQKGMDVEFIIIDGGSSDRTVEIIMENNKHIDYWISEPDKGIYDAWNKGLNAGTGKWVMFLGADDQLNTEAIEKYTEFICKVPNIEDIDYISSRMEVIDKHGKILRVRGRAWGWPLFLKDMSVAHPGSLHSRKLFEQYGVFNTEYKIAGDYELLLRPKDKLRALFMDIITVKMQEGGASDSLKALVESKKAVVQTGGLSLLSAKLNHTIIRVKFIVKATLRKIGINAYLKR